MSYFDEFTKVLAGNYSRRQMLGKMAGVFGGAVAGVFTFSGRSSAAYTIACTNFCRTIVVTAQRNVCLAVCTANGGSTYGLCRVGNTVKRCPVVPNATNYCNTAGTCLFTCAPGFSKCGDNCVPTQGNDPFNCGGCGITCQQGQNCVNGQCIGCAVGLTNCSGTCVNTQTDPNNCNGCFAQCPPDANGMGVATCTAGLCAVTCNQGLTNCGTQQTPACTDTLSDANNCNVCGNACPAGTPTCCAGQCSDLQSDPNNCNACGNVCPGPNVGTGTAICNAGACGIFCVPPLFDNGTGGCELL